MTGLYTERGIHRLDGFLAEYTVDQEQYVVKVPPELTGMAVLAEPVSIAEKGIEQIKTIQSRLPWACHHPDHDFNSPDWGGCKTALVVGAGPLGLLAVALLRLAGVNTVVTDILPEDNIKASLAGYLGATYVDGSTRTPKELVESCGVTGHLDIIFEASGAATTALELINYMSRSSIYVMTGIPRAELDMELDAAQVVRQIVRYNQVIVGSVNSNRRHFEQAVSDLEEIKKTYPELPQKMFTNRYRLEEFEQAFGPKGPENIKTMITVSPWD